MHKLDSSVPTLVKLLSWVGLEVPQHTAIGIRAEYPDHTQYLLEMSKKELFPNINTPVNEHWMALLQSFSIVTDW